MKIDLNPLDSGIKKSIEINEVITFLKEEVKNTSIKEIGEVYINGNVHKINEGVYNLYLNIKTNLSLEDAITLENITYPVNITLDKKIGENLDEEDEYYKIFNNTLDILPIVWENIVLEVPLRVVLNEKDTVIEGDGWSLNKKEVTNPFSELKELLDMEGKR